MSGNCSDLFEKKKKKKEASLWWGYRSDIGYAAGAMVC